MTQTAELEDSTAGPDYSKTAAGNDPNLAEWLRPPRGRLYGLSRGTIYKLAAEGHIRSITLRKKGRVRGARLFYGPDLRAYLRGELERQNPQHGKEVSA